MSWINPPSHFKEQIEKDHSDMVASIGLRILRGLVTTSPKDTGRFQGNWVVGIGARATSVRGVVPSGVAIELGASELKKHAGYVTIFISNNLAYAQRLNEGHSQQAPANFVQRILTRVIRG